MIRSENRIPTAHTGSLPRPDDLIQMVPYQDLVEYPAMAQGADIASKKLWS